MIKCIFFDFDGVILESADLKTQAFELLAKEEFPDFASDVVAYHRKHMGISRFVKFRHVYENLLNKPLESNEETRLGERFTEIIFEQLLQVPFVPGAIEFLVRHQNRYAMFVASGTPEPELQEIARRRNLDGYFKQLCGSPRGKQEIVEGILKEQGVMPREAVFVGDAESDYIAAKTTGVPFIARTADGAFSPADAFAKIKDLTELETVLKNIRGSL